MKRLAILGASGHGKVIADMAIDSGWQEVVFFDDRHPELAKNGSWPVIGDTKALIAALSSFDGVIVAIGSNATRLHKQNELKALGASLVNIIHPNATISSHAVPGKGCVVMAGAVINIGTTLGDACIVNTGATIDHDCVLGDGVHISPGAHLAGGVVVGFCSWIGMGANVKQLVRIGANVTVGAGAVVVHDFLEPCTVAGVPARVLRSA